MKKIMICLLSLGMIAGCAQQPIEPPIEPPVVGEPEEQPEEPIEEVIDEVSDIAEIKPYEYDVQEVQLLTDIDYLNTFVYQIPLIKSQSVDALNFNNEMERLQASSINESIYDDEGYLLDAKLQRVEAFLSKNILTIFFYKMHYGWQTSVIITQEVVNFDVDSEKFMTNTEIMNKLGLNIDDVEDQVSNYLTDNCIKDDKNTLTGKRVYNFDPKIEDRIFYPISENTQLSVIDGELHVFVEGMDGMKNVYFEVIVKEKIKNDRV